MIDVSNVTNAQILIVGGAFMYKNMQLYMWWKDRLYYSD